MKQPVKVVVTGAAGQIGYSILFRIANGDMLGKDQPIILNLLDLESAYKSLSGIVMELNDCAFPLLHKINFGHNQYELFENVDYAILVGARPRSKGMERKDLLSANAEIFVNQGKALNKVAKKSVKVLVVGNPANTNCLILAHNAPHIDPRNFTAMMRLDHNRAIYQLADKLMQPTAAIKKMIIWGNHSNTQVPYINESTCANKKIVDHLDNEWIVNTFTPAVQKRGSAIIEARGLSSAASAANAAINHINNWVLDTPPNDWVTMGVPSDGSYGIPAGVIFGFPVTCANGTYEIVQNLTIGSMYKNLMLLSYNELLSEKNDVINFLQ